MKNRDATERHGAKRFRKTPYNIALWGFLGEILADNHPTNINTQKTTEQWKVKLSELLIRCGGPS